MKRFGWLCAFVLSTAFLLVRGAPGLFARTAGARAVLPEQAGSPGTQAAPAADPDKKDEGIPVTSDLVKQKCASCHQADDKGRLTRISYRRTTPEGWEETIKRMVSLNN